MDGEESERQRKLKAGREKLLQFQQKTRGAKKKKKPSSKSSKSKSEAEDDGVQQHSGEIGGNSPVHSEQDVSIASADTEKDVSSIASEVEEQVKTMQKEPELFTQSGGESAGGSYASESYTSGDESFTSEVGGVDDLVIANLERNELKNRTVELEEELVAKKTALKEISKENAELKAKLEGIARASSEEGHANVVLDLNERISDLEKTVDEKQSSLQELQKENGYLRKRIEESQDLDRSESSQIEELRGKLTTKQVTLDELNKQNEELSNQVRYLQTQLSESPKDDINSIVENLKLKENSVQHLSVENENQRSVIKSLEEGLNQNKTQLLEYHKALQLKDQELQQVANSWKGYLSQNLSRFNEQLTQKEQQLNIASQEITKLQELLNEKDNENVSKDTAEDYTNKISELNAQLDEKNTALQDLENQVLQFANKQKQGEEEVVLLKTHIQEQTEQLISMQEILDNSNTMHEEKDNKIATLQQRLDTVTQTNEDMRSNSQTIAEQMVELKTVLDDRDQKISHLELNLSELAEERELLKNEMANQTQELLNQVKDLRAQLQESNAKVQDQSDEMENSFSELHATKDMIKDLQKEMLEKDLAFDSTSQKLQTTEEILEEIQRKFVEEKERLQNELNEKDKLLEEINISFSEAQEELNKDKTKIENLSAEIESYQKQVTVLGNEIAQKDGTLKDFGQRLDESKQGQDDEIESLKLELEFFKEGASNSGQKMIEISEKYQEQIEHLQKRWEESESRIHELKDEVERSGFLISKAESGQTEALERARKLEEQLGIVQQKHDEEILQLNSIVEKQQDIAEKTEAALCEAKIAHKNEVDILKSSNEEMLVNLRNEFDQRYDQLKSSSLAEQSRLVDDIEQVRNHYEKELTSMNEVNKELQEKLTVSLQEQEGDTFNEEENFTCLKEQIQHQKEEYDKMKKLSESLTLEKEDLLTEKEEITSELNKYLEIQADHEKQVELLNKRIKTLEDDLVRLQATEQQLLTEKDFSKVMASEEDVRKLNEKLEQQEQEHGKELQLLRGELTEAKESKETAEEDKHRTMELLKASEEKVTMLDNRVLELQQSQEMVLQEKQQTVGMLKKAESKVSEIENEHGRKVHQLESELQESLQNHEETVTSLQETEELLRNSREELREKTEAHENELKQLLERLQEIQESQEQSATEQLQKVEENLKKKSLHYENENKLLQDIVKELEESQAMFIAEKQELQDLLNKSKSEVLEKEGEHENEIRQMDEQLEQTRQVIETIRAENDRKVSNLEESLQVSEQELQRKLQVKENEYQELLKSMQREHEDLKSELEKSKVLNDDLQKRVQTLVSEKEELVHNGKGKGLENYDWNSNSFEQQPVVQESVTFSDNWMDVQGETGDGWDWSVPDENIPTGPNKSTPQQASVNEVESLERIAILQEKLAEKDKNEVQLIEEKNKLLKIVKEYNDSLANERDSLKEKIIDQDETIKNLQDQLSMSELVSSDLQQVFAQQLVVLEKQRDSLLNQLDEQQKERSSFVDILEEKHALEENLRSEKEQLADKLRQKEVLERQLDDERAALQEQLIRQARLNEIIREKDVLEQELTEQKNRLQLELSGIEESLLAKQQLLKREKEALREELLEKESQLETWQGELKTREEQEREERELLEKNFKSTLLATRTALEDTYQQNLEHLRTELEDSYKQRLFDVEENHQAHHKQEMASLSRQHEQQVAGVKAEYEEKIKNLKRMLEEQRQRQVITMKSVLERDRANEVQHLMDSHDDDMEKLRKELNVRHQDIVNAIVSRLKQTHQQEMEDCMASAVTDTVLKVEVARLEVEKEHEVKFSELRENSQMEIRKLRKMHEEEVTKLEAQVKDEMEQRELLEKQHAESNEELHRRHKEDLEKQLTALRERLNIEHQENLEKTKEGIEIDYENQMETLQDELEEKFDNDLRELREELDKQGREITASAIEELQRKHFMEIDVLKSEHEHICAQMSAVKEKLETDLQEDVQDMSEKLEREKEKVKQMSLRVEELLKESKEEESEKISSLQTTMEQKITFLQQEHQEKMTDMEKKQETKLKKTEDEFNEQLRTLRSEFEKDKIEVELKHMTEVRELSNNNDKKISDKEQQHVAEINKLQQKLALVREENEENTFRELEESRQQLSEKFQKDLDAIVRELKLQHQKEIDNLISEAELNQSGAERDAFETWKKALIEKHEKEIRELKSEQQKEFERTRALFEREKANEVDRVSRAANAKTAEALEELRRELTSEFEEESGKAKLEYQSNFDTEIGNLITKYQSLREQHDATVRELQDRLNTALAEQLGPLNKELRICQDLIQEKEMEIENLKRQHEKDLKELKQRNFDDLVEEVSEVRADLALDAAREVEVVKLESDYKTAKKVKEIQDAYLKEIAEHVAKVESLEREKKTFEELLRSHAEETRELQAKMEKEKNELKHVHNEEMEDLKTRLDVEQQNALNELKGKLMKEIDDTQEMGKRTLVSQQKELEQKFMQREAEIKDNEFGERELILNKLKAEHGNEVNSIRESLGKEHEISMRELQEDYKDKIKEIEVKWAAEKEQLVKENEQLVKEKDEVLEQAKEQHRRELEAAKEELVKTHMEKFTSMTEKLDQSHQEELQTKLKQAEEVARYHLEKEHLENLKKLEEDLKKKHESQLSALNDLVEQHRAQIKTLSEHHAVEKQEIENNWQQKLADELSMLKNEQREEMLLKESLLDKAETEIRRAVLEIDTKEKKIIEMTEFIEKTSGEYEERLAKIRKDFEDKLQDMKTDTDSSNEEKFRGIQEMLSKQHAEELERIKTEHDQHIELVNVELEGERALKVQIQEELEQKLAEHTGAAAEQERVLKTKLKEMENEIVQLKERNDAIQKTLEEKEKDYIQLQEQKQAVDIDVRTLEGHIRDIENREERQQRENNNLIQMLRADLDAMNSERDSVERAKAKLLKQLTTAVRTTMAIEDTITSRLETLFEQKMREEDEETASEVASLPEAEDSIPEGFRRRQAAGLLASSTPAAPAGAQALDNEGNENERTVTGDKQADLSMLSDEGLEVSVILSDNQGSLDVQDEETVVDSGNRLRVAVKKLLDIVASVSRQLNDARATQDELLNTTSQRTEELNQLTQAQNVLMLRLQEEIETKEDVMNKLRNAEEEMEVHIGNVERLENLVKEKENERLLLEERSTETQREIQELLREKEELQKGVEKFKSRSEDMEKAFEKEKQELCDKIMELQNKVKDSESEIRLHLSEDSHLGVSVEREEAVSKEVSLAEEKPPTPQKEDLNAKIASLEAEFKIKEEENMQLKEVQSALNNELSNLKESKDELEKELHENKAEFLNLKQDYEKEVDKRRTTETQKQEEYLPGLQDEVPGSDKLVEENESLKKEVDTLKKSIKTLTNDLHNINKEKDDLQSEFQDAEIAWEEEKNELQQQLYDSCLEASSFKDRLNKAGNVVELQEKLSQQNEAYLKLETDASNLENEVTSLKESLSVKEKEVDELMVSVEELKEGLQTQQNILEERRVMLVQAENGKALDKEEISKLKEALAEAERNVEDGETKMQEILKNMKNLETTYKAETNETTQQLNEKVEYLQEELNEVNMKLEQEKQSKNVIRSHINDLKQQHLQEMQSCKSQFEADIQSAIERTKQQQAFYNGVEEPIGDFTTHQLGYESEPDLNMESRINVELKNVDGFTKTIAGYLSDLKHENIGEEEDLNSSTTEKIESVLDDLRLEADAVYHLVNSLPAFCNPNISSLHTAWEEEKEMLSEAIEQLRAMTVERPEELSVGSDWRGVIMSAVLDVLRKEDEILSSELEAMDSVAHDDVISASNLTRRRQQKQDELHRQSVDRLYETDRISLLTEIDQLKKSMIVVKQELTSENHKLQEQLKAIQQQVRKRETELLQQVTSKEELLEKERELRNIIQNEREAEAKQLNEACNLLARERTVAKDLQEVVNKKKTRFNELESALEKERTQNTVIQTCLESERARCSNLEQALKHERLNVDSRERELEKKNLLLQELSNREKDTIKDLEDEVILGKEQLSELETQLHEEKTRNEKLEKEVADKQSVSASDNDKLKNLIKDLRDELERQKTQNTELVASLNKEKKVSEDLKTSLESLHGVNEQIAEQEQLITELSQAFENERLVNEELRNALDNNYEENDKTDDRQLSVVKELQMSLTAVQEQLRNQIDVVDQERNRVKRLRKERDIHEASALGARTKERNLERELEKEKAAREMEVGNLKDMLEHEIALKRNLEQVLSERNSEFENVRQELKYFKDGRKTTMPKTPPNNPSKDRLNILRHDLKSIIDEHRVLLIMHKEHLEKQLKKSDDSPEVSNLYSHIQNLSHEMDRMKKQVGTFSEGSPIRLSPMKTAAYERITKQNKEMSDYLAKLTDEKSELRTTLCHLELQISQYRDREANYLENMRRNKHEMEAMLANERTRAAQESLTLHQRIEGQKREMNALEDKLHEREIEVDETKRSLQMMEDQLERNKASTKRLQSSESYVSHWTPARIQKLYARYIRAEKSRKSLVYQKRYLVLLLGGFREHETRTLAMIAKMGAFPSYHEPSSRFSPAFTKFRTAVRVIVATKRMQFLVAKSKKSIRQVMEQVDSKSSFHRNSQSHTKSVYNDHQYDSYRPNYHQGNHSVPSRFATAGEDGLNGYSSQQGDISLDAKDNSFAEIYAGNVDTAVPKHTDCRVYSAFDYKPSKMVTHGASANHTQDVQPNSDLMNRLESRNVHSMPHSPPVRERPNSQGSIHPSVRPPFPSYQTYPFETEPSSIRDVRTSLRFDPEDLDRKIQTLDNLQQKLSLNRGTKERDR